MPIFSNIFYNCHEYSTIDDIFIMIFTCFFIVFSQYFYYLVFSNFALATTLLSINFEWCQFYYFSIYWRSFMYLNICWQHFNSSKFSKPVIIHPIFCFGHKNCFTVLKLYFNFFDAFKNTFETKSKIYFLACGWKKISQ